MDKGELTIIEGDATNPQTTYNNEVPLIPHCCNNLGVMGAGVALALRNKWTGVYEAYLRGSKELGYISYWIKFTDEIEVPKRRPIVAVYNMIGQDGTVSKDNSKPVKYWALVDAMRKVRDKIDSLSLAYPECKFVIHAPKFGSDLAMGNWDFILELIKEIWIDAGIDVVIYEYNG